MNRRCFRRSLRWPFARLVDGRYRLSKVSAIGIIDGAEAAIAECPLLAQSV